MANKGILAVLAVVVVASFGVGVLIGLQVGGGGTATTGPANGTNGTTPTPGADATPTPGAGTTATPGGGPTPTPGDGTTATDGGPTATATGTPQTATRTPIPAVRFSEREIAENVSRLINEKRTANGNTTLSTSGNTVQEIRTMARNHSNSMAAAGQVVHELNGLDTRQRYKAFDLFQTCKIQTQKGNIKRPDHQFEALAKTYAGTTYQQGGRTRFNANEKQVAQAVVNQWMNNAVYRQRILRYGYGRLGVGVTVVRDGTVYVTADFCA